MIRLNIMGGVLGDSVGILSGGFVDLWERIPQGYAYDSRGRNHWEGFRYRTRASGRQVAT
jgi:hypothetical protein